jgi:hypothetical protein
VGFKSPTGEGAESILILDFVAEYYTGTMLPQKTWRAIVIPIIFTALSLAQSSAPQDTEAVLKKFLQSYAKKRALEQELRYFNSFVDLNDDGRKEAVVYLYGPGICGSGGCNTLVLTPYRSSYRVIAGIIISNPPIRVLNTSSPGWRTLAIWERGGGGRSGEVELPFNGKTYPFSPSNASAQRPAKPTPGETVIPSYMSFNEGKPLFDP